MPEDDAMEMDSRSGEAGKGSLEELMRERIRATIEAIVEEELEAALGAGWASVTPGGTGTRSRARASRVRASHWPLHLGDCQ